MRVLVAGNANVDVILGPLSPWPKTGTEVLVENYQLRVGGALGNIALALHALGVPGLYAANVGDDALGAWLRAELARRGCNLTVTSGPTAVTVGLSHPDAERTFVSYQGHLAMFDIDVLRTQLEKLALGDVLVVCGYFLVPALQKHAFRVCQLARERGVVVLLDTGWPPGGWEKNVKAEVLGLLNVCDYFLPNREELAGLTGESGVLKGLQQLPKTLYTVVKLGEAGAAHLESGNLVQVRAPEVTVVDTVGAGDSFNAAFVYSLGLGTTLQQATEIAVRAASAAISSRPRRYAVPNDITPTGEAQSTDAAEM